MMEFNELYETLLNAAKGHDSFTLNMVKTSKETYRAIYEHGAASRQAEVVEVIQNLIKRADEKAGELHIRNTEYVYFQGMVEGFNTLLHSIGLDDDCDKTLKGKKDETGIN